MVINVHVPNSYKKMEKLGNKIYSLNYINLSQKQNLKTISKPRFKSDLTVTNVLNRWNNNYGSRNKKTEMLYISEPENIIDYKMVNENK